MVGRSIVVASLNPNCKLCGLWEYAEPVCVAGVGPKNPDVVIVSDSPLPLRRGIPTAGEPRKILERELQKNGLQDAYITNLVKCQTPDKRAPTQDEVRACKPYLEKELLELNPKFVLTIGLPPTKAL